MKRRTHAMRDAQEALTKDYINLLLSQNDAMRRVVEATKPRWGRATNSRTGQEYRVALNDPAKVFIDLFPTTHTGSHRRAFAVDQAEWRIIERVPHSLVDVKTGKPVKGG